jgi:DNA-binding transcriptional regulator LsrR (DeoR family)
VGRPRTEHTSELTAAVVYLLRAGYRAKDIAFELGIKRPYVSKLRRWAEASRLIEPAPPVSGPAWTHEHEVRALRILDKSPTTRVWKLLSIMHRRELLTKPLSIHVFPSVHHKEQDWEERLDHFGIVSAPYIRKLLCKSSSVGVSWGGTIDAITGGIEQSRRSSTPRRPVFMLPVCGEPLGYTVGTVRLSATSLATRLAVAINGSAKHTRSLSAVPSFIPIDFRDEAAGALSEVDVVKKLMGRVPSHAEIFGGESPVISNRGKTRRPWIKRLSMVLTSVGLDGIPFGQGSAAYLKAAGLSPECVRQLASTDISGIILERANLSVENTRLLQRIQNHWTGITLRDLQACAGRARRRPTSRGRGVGVVVAAIGRQKAGAILECLTRGIVSHLFIDTDLQDQLNKLLVAMNPGNREVPV